jgi:hypothetical protein
MSNPDEQDDLALLRKRWLDVLDELLIRDRVAWLAFFDARLVRIEEGSLILDFSDPEKFAGAHDFAKARNPRHRELLQEVIAYITGVEVRVVERVS